MNRFDGRKVLITGGTRGIGRAAAEAFLTEGAQVVISGTTESSVAAAVAEMSAANPAGSNTAGSNTAGSNTAGASLSGVSGDVSDVNECGRIVQSAVEKLHGLDILVNSAGVFQHATIEETDEEVWNRIMDVNVRGSYFCSRAAVSSLRQRMGGCIVHLGSESGVNGYGGSTAYCASKGAIVNLTRSMSMELAPDVRVNAVCPGIVDTEMAREGFAIDGDADKGIQQQRENYPLKRVATAAEIAAAILYLSSDDARFITGESLVMDGGATVGK